MFYCRSTTACDSHSLHPALLPVPAPSWHRTVPEMASAKTPVPQPETAGTDLLSAARHTVYLISGKIFRKMILPQALRSRGAGFVVHNRRKFRLLFGAQRHTHL